MPAVDTNNVIKEQLAKKDVHCAVYSGSFTDVENSDNFSSWQDGKVAVMVATSAFGVGVDYPSVRTVFLYGLPYTVEDYSQQCGRDGKPSSSSVFMDITREEAKLKHMKEGSLERNSLQEMLR